MSKSQKGKGKPSKKKAAPRPAKVVKTKKPTEAVKEENVKKPAPKPKAPVEKKESPRPQVKAEAVTLGPLPSAKVESRHIDSLHERAGRGFSFGELASASISLVSAKRHGLALDIRRRSVVEANVDSLKSWFKTPAKATPAKKSEENASAKKK